MKPLRHALRRLGRAPGFTAVALITLALGIGANTAIFSVVNAVLLKPLPYPNADRLVGVWHVAPGVQGLTGDVNCSPTMYYTYREQSRAFQSIGLWSQGGVSVTGIGDPERLTAVFMTFGTLDTLRVQPVAGRWFSQADDSPGTPATVILSHGYWQRRFGGNASAIGGSLTVDGRQRTIIGVMPRDFRFLDLKPDLLFPERLDRNKIFLGQFSYQGIARLKPGITIQQANSDIARIIPIWLDAWPTPPGFSRELFKNAHF